MCEHCDIVLATLKGLVSNWYTVEIISEFAGLTIDETADALCDLGLAGDVEIDEWEDGIRVCLKKKEEPLTEDQKAFVQQWIPLAYKMAVELYDRKWQANEELAQYLCCELIDIVKRYDPETCPNFLTYACPCLRGARNHWHLSQTHLRGYKLGKAYDNMPEIQDMNFDDPEVRDEFESAFSYDNRKEYEIRDEVLEMISRLSYEQAQAVILTEYYEMTLAEAAESLHTTRTRLNKIKQDGLENLKTQKTSKKQKKEYSSDFKCRLDFMPRLLIGSSNPWPAHGLLTQKKKKKKEVKPCPVCGERPLDEISYCLYCDRWGMDVLTKLIPRPNYMKTTTVTMTKARDKYRNNNLSPAYQCS